MAIEIKRLAHGLGAQIRGIDPTKPLDQDTIKAVRAAWLAHKAVVFPDMEMTPAQHVAFSRSFGELELHLLPSVRHQDHPEIMEVTNRIINGKPAITSKTGREWHSDGAFTTCPPTGSLLHCRELPDVGGDTWFSNMVMAYDTLSPTMKRMIEPLRVVNNLQKSKQRTRDPLQTDDENRRLIPPVVQPMVRVHPETGLKALYLSETITTQVFGMSVEESEGLLNYLFEHSVRAPFTYRHSWSKWDLVMWDNRSTMHLAPGDYDPSQVRRMFRTTLVGTPSGTVYEDELAALAQAEAAAPAESRSVAQAA